MLDKYEKIERRTLGASQQTLLGQRIAALRIALALITRQIEARY